MRNKYNPTAIEIINRIDDARNNSGFNIYTKYNYIILGRPGLTGKTSLCKYLKDHGHNAVELSEAICDLVDYRDNINHFIVDHANEQIIIVLNRSVKE